MVVVEEGANANIVIYTSPLLTCVIIIINIIVSQAAKLKSIKD